MNSLTYRGLTLAEGQQLVGQPVGCGPYAEPLQVIAVELPVGGGPGCVLVVDEWDIDLPGYGPAKQSAEHTYRRVTLPGFQRMSPPEVTPREVK